MLASRIILKIFKIHFKNTLVMFKEAFGRSTLVLWILILCEIFVTYNLKKISKDQKYQQRNNVVLQILVCMLHILVLKTLWSRSSHWSALGANTPAGPLWCIGTHCWHFLWNKRLTLKIPLWLLIVNDLKAHYTLCIFLNKF